MNAVFAAKGFVSGGLLSLAVFSLFDPIIRIIMFIIGFIVFVDSVMPRESKFYAVTVVFFLVISGLIGFFSTITGMDMVYMVVVLVMLIIVYLRLILGFKQTIKT